MPQKYDLNFVELYTGKGD